MYGKKRTKIFVPSGDVQIRTLCAQKVNGKEILDPQTSSIVVADSPLHEVAKSISSKSWQSSPLQGHEYTFI